MRTNTTTGICPGCGASLQPDEVLCPYCGHENEAVAAAEHAAEVRGIYQRIAAMLRLPEQRTRRLSHLLLLLTACVVLLTLLVLFAAFLFSRLGPEADYRRQQKNLTALEELYAAGDYAAIGQKLERMDDAYSAVYDKYSITADLFGMLSSVQADCAETVAFLREYPAGADLLHYDLDRLFSLLHRCDALAQAGYVYGEQAAIDALRAGALELLQHTLFLTDAEIASGRLLAAEDTPDYTALCLAAAERIAGGDPA